MWDLTSQERGKIADKSEYLPSDCESYASFSDSQQ